MSAQEMSSPAVPETDIDQFEPPEYFIATLNRQIREMMEFSLRPFGLKLVEWRLMQCLETRPTLTICDLAELAVVERTVTSRLIDKLVKRNLVEKVQLETDRRFSQISLTTEGIEKLAECQAEVRKARQHLFSGLRNPDIDVFLETLNKLMANASTLPRKR